jgi:hypothetical protein
VTLYATLKKRLVGEERMTVVMKPAYLRRAFVPLLLLFASILLVVSCSGDKAGFVTAPSFSPCVLTADAEQYDLVFAVAGDSRSELEWVDPHSDNPDYSGYMNVAALGTLRDCLISYGQGKPGFFFMHVGDFAMRGGTPVYEAFLEEIAPLQAAGIPVYATLGNHEVRYYGPKTVGRKSGQAESDANALRAQNQYQAMIPAAGLVPADAHSPTDYGGLAYYFRRGSSVFISLDAYYVNHDDPADAIYKKGYYSDFQLQWLQDTFIKYKNMGGVENIFVFSHQPAFDANAGKGRFYANYNSPDSNRSNWILWSLLDTYEADAFFAGHSHFYHRWNISGGKSSSDGGKPFEYLWGETGDGKWRALGSDFNVSNLDDRKEEKQTWQTVIPHIINGTCGAKPQGFDGNSVQADKRANEYNFSIVKVKGSTILIEVYSYDVGAQPVLIDKIQKTDDQWQNLLP